MTDHRLPHRSPTDNPIRTGHSDDQSLDRLTRLIEELGLDETDLDELVDDLTHSRASSRVNNRDAEPDLEFDEAFDLLHDEANRTAGAINNHGLPGQLAVLLDAYDEPTLTTLLRDLRKPATGGPNSEARPAQLTWDQVGDNPAFPVTVEFDADGAMVTDSLGRPAHDRLRTNVIRWAQEHGYRTTHLDENALDRIRSAGNLDPDAALRSPLDREVTAAVDWLNRTAAREHTTLVWVPDAENPTALSERPTLALDPQLRGSMINGYDNDRINRILGRISDVSGLEVICLWDLHDHTGLGGDSDYHVVIDGRLHCLGGELAAWLNSEPDDPSAPITHGIPADWIGAPTDITVADLPYHDDFHNYAARDLCRERPTR